MYWAVSSKQVCHFEHSHSHQLNCTEFPSIPLATHLHSVIITHTWPLSGKSSTPFTTNHAPYISALIQTLIVWSRGYKLFICPVTYLLDPWSPVDPEWAKGWQNHSGPLTSSTLPLWTTAVWSTLQSSEHQNDQTQEQFSSPKQSISWTPDINVEHTTLFYNYLFTTHTYIIYIFFFPFQICTCQTCTRLSVLHSVFAILYIAYLYICILFFCHLCPVPLLSFCCTVKLCHYNKFLVCVNIPGQ